MKNALISLYTLFALTSCCDAARPSVPAPVKQESEAEEIEQPIIFELAPITIELAPVKEGEVK